MKKVFFFSEIGWAYGSIYRSIIPFLHKNGIYSDIIDWRISYDYRNMKFINDSCDYWITTPSEVGSLLSYNCIPIEKIIFICHGQLEILKAIERFGIDIFNKVKDYAVVSQILAKKSKEFGVTRIPKVLKVGVDKNKFTKNISNSLKTVGYTGAIKSLNYSNQDIKRGFLAKECAEKANLRFIPSTEYDEYKNTTGLISIQGMPSFYGDVDCIIISSSEESVGLPLLEASVSGKLVIGTNVGYMSEYDVGIKVPIEQNSFISETTEKLLYYKNNNSAYKEKCQEILEKSVVFHWDNCISDWVNLMS